MTEMLGSTRPTAAVHRQERSWRVLLSFAAIILVGITALARSQAPAGALVADLQGPIGPASSHFVDTVIEAAQQRNARLVVLRLDTPGGLSDSMREIIKGILASPVPVVVYVAPSGARAASAGTYILYASHLAAMAPGTNVGAATPIRLGGGLPLPRNDRPSPAADGPDGDAARPAPVDPAEAKMVNDAVAYIRGLAQLRGRNTQWAELAVREAASLPAEEALAKGVIDLIAPDIEALLARADGREVSVNGTTVVLHTAGLHAESIEPSWQTRLLAILTNPNLAFVLMMVGIYGLVFEFSTPGSIGPGVLGGICLLLGLYALNLLPLDYAALALLLLGVAFMVAEAFTPTFGILGLGGLAAFLLGASLLLDSESPHFRLSFEVIAASGIASGAFLVLLLGYALKTQRRAVSTGPAELLAQPATVLEWADHCGYVRVRGERWRARSRRDFEPGSSVVVTAVSGLEVEVSSPDEARTQE
jgi:membrane-bound serine protease (ClpP class)